MERKIQNRALNYIGVIWVIFFWEFMMLKPTRLSGKKVKKVLDIIGAIWGENWLSWGGICPIFDFFHDNKVQFHFLVDILL